MLVQYVQPRLYYYRVSRAVYMPLPAAVQQRRRRRLNEQPNMLAVTEHCLTFLSIYVLHAVDNQCNAKDNNTQTQCGTDTGAL